MLRSLRTSMTALALVAATMLAAPAASAAEQSGGDITWMVRPSDGVGEDGRAWVELELDPGEVVTEHLLVRNLSASPVTFALSSADGYFTENGRFNMLTADQESVDAGTWIDVQDAIEVPPGEDAVVPFTVTVPDNATPGDHPAGIAAGIRSGGDEVGIESRVGFRVMTRVSGELAPAVAATASGSFAGSWNPFGAGRLDVTYAVENTGNARLSVAPQISVSALFGLVSFTASGDAIAEMAPGGSRTGSLAIPSAWPLFAYSVSVDAAATPVTDDVAAADVSAGATAVVVALPWPQLIVLALVMLFGWMLWRDRRRRDRIVASRIEQAREEGRAAAQEQRTSHARVGVGLAVALLALALVVGGDSRAEAAVAEDGGTVVLRVDVTDAPTPGPTSAATPPVGGSSSGLASTGGLGDLLPFAGVGLAAIAIGVTVQVVRTTRRNAGPQR